MYTRSFSWLLWAIKTKPLHTRNSNRPDPWDTPPKTPPYGLSQRNPNALSPLGFVGSWVDRQIAENFSDFSPLGFVGSWVDRQIAVNFSDFSPLGICWKLVDRQIAEKFSDFSPLGFVRSWVDRQIAEKFFRLQSVGICWKLGRSTDC